MGCIHSKASAKIGKKKKGKDKASTQKDGSGKVPLDRLQEVRVWRDVLTSVGSKESESLLDGQQRELLRLVQEHIKKVVEDKTVDLNAQFQKTVNGIEEEQRAKEEDLRQSHDKEMSLIRDAFQEAEVLLQAQVGVLTAQLQRYKELQSRVTESTLKRDLQRNIEAHGSPGKFWEQELESLLFVIEMKSKRLEAREQQLVEMEALRKRNASLEDQLARAVQRKENLQFRYDSLQNEIQQLQVDMMLLTQAQEKADARVHRLLQEKEELLCKMKHGADLPRFS